MTPTVKTLIFATLCLFTQGAAHAGTALIECTESLSDTDHRPAQRMEVLHTDKQVRAGFVDQSTNGAPRLGPTSVYAPTGDDGIYTYAFATIEKEHIEHCGNEYDSSDFHEWIQVKIEEIENLLSNNTIKDKWVYKLKYNSKNPLMSELESQSYTAYMTTPFTRDGYISSGNQPIVTPMQCQMRLYKQ